MLSYAQKHTAIDPRSVYGLRVLVEGAYYYYVIAVNRYSEKALRKVLSHPLQQVNFSQFGKILLSGKGANPDDRAIQMLKEKYAIEVRFL